jgi:hypothetical protein
MCTHTYDAIAETWAHEVEPVVDSPLWWRANHVIDANLTDARGNKGGRPVAMQPANWLTGSLDCPECGGKLYTNNGKTPAGNLRTAKLRCGGTQKERLTCRRFAPVDASIVADGIDAMFSGDHTPVLAFQRVSGNAHELDELKAGLSRIQARLSATEDDDELDALVAERKSVKTRIEFFKVIPDSYDYAPTGQTVAGMWSGDVTVKRNMVKAVKTSWGLGLAPHDGQWAIKVGTDFTDMSDADGIVDLGNGLCFRRPAA